MTSELYSIDIDFTSGVELSQLKTELENALIPVEDVHREDDTIYIFLSEAALRETIDIVVAAHTPMMNTTMVPAEEFKLTNCLQNLYHAERLNMNVVKNTQNDIGGLWSQIEGMLMGFDLNTGVFTIPTTGVYQLTLMVSTLNAQNNTDIHLLMKDSTDVVMSGITNRLSNSHSPTYTFLSCHDLYYTGDTMKFSVDVDTNNITVDVVFKVFRILSC